MRITATLNIIGKLFGEEKALGMIAAGGYDCVDFSLVGMVKDDDPWLRSDYRERAERIVGICKENRLAVGQAHAPWHFRWADEACARDIAIPRTIRSMEIAALLGAPVIVIHPLHHLRYREYGTLELERNLAFYRQLQPYAERFGIQIALENMFQNDENGSPCRDVYADAGEFSRALDLLGDDSVFTACVDAGHCNLTKCCTPAEMIRALGHDRVRVVHLHDNDGIRDSHTLPYLGNLDWDDVCAALRDIGYAGDLGMEIQGGYYARFTDPQLMTEAIRLAAATGRRLAEKIENPQI